MAASKESDELWERYRGRGDQTARDQLIINYSPLVKYVASRMRSGLPDHVEHADLVSYGMFGLINAIEKFDTELGFEFSTYAMPRIKGAILDELRALDWVPRSVRSKARRVEEAIGELEHELGRSPSDEEVAERMGITPHALQDLLGQVSFGGQIALDEIVASERGSGVSRGDVVADDDAPVPGAALEMNEMRQLLAGSIQQLPDREKQVLGLYYFEGLTMAAIGEIMGVTESRICQIHSRALLQLRSRLAAADAA